MNRLDRLTAILIQLQSKRVIKASEIAAKFDISLRTVYRDIRSLEKAGVPIGAEAGKGYFIVDGYHLPPVTLTKEEASALLTGGKLIEQFTDNAIRDSFHSSLDKIKSVLRNNEKDYLESLQEQIAVQTPPAKHENPNSNNYLLDIQQALVKKQVLKIDYFANYNEASSTRLVEPLGLYYYGNGWHLIAYCRLRKNFRDFRVERIQSLSANNEHFDSSRHIPFQAYLKQLTSEMALIPVQVAFDKTAMRYLREQRYYYGYLKEKIKGRSVEMTFLTLSLESFGRWLLTYGDSVKIISPPELKGIMKNLVEELQKHYQ